MSSDLGTRDGRSGTARLTLLFDGGCPLCLREVTFLQRRDRRLHPDAPQLAFVDINADDYNSAANGGISYREAMGRIHALTADGQVLRDVAVFREAYRLIGLGWLYAPSAWPGLRQLADGLYGLWAQWRLPLTRRPSLDQLCSCRSEARSGADSAADSEPDPTTDSETAANLAGGQAAVEQQQH